MHELTGLRPDALATYLAGLGVFRLLAEQRDDEVRAFWRDEHFVLVTKLQWEEIESFFANEYKPTPILAPWNMESGFFSLKPSGEAPTEASEGHHAPEAGDVADADDNSRSDEPEEDDGGEDETEEAVGDPLLDRFEATTAERFSSFRKAIAIARKAIPEKLRQAEKDARHAYKEKKTRGKECFKEAKKRFKAVQSEAKERLIADLRARWGAEGQQWVDAAVALDERNKKGFEFTALFGSGGNDGRMEFTKNLRHHLNALFDLASGTPRDDAAAKLRGALFAGANQLLSGGAVGQFFPGRAGGANMGAGFEGGAAVNSWEFVLMLEGAVALVSGMSRRGEIGRARLSSPFWVDGAVAGFGSASAREGSRRGEQWLPLWSRPLRYSELVELVREGRAQVGRRQATRAADLVRATARLGLARGIDSLQRFAYLQRNGQSNLAVFTGRFHVRSRPGQELLDDIAPWIDRIVEQTKDKNVPASLGAVARRTQDALFSVCRREVSRDWRDLLIALGEAEDALLRSGKSASRRPLPPLNTGWIAAVDDSTPEGRLALRLALAFASQHRPVENESGELLFRDSIRQHFMPLNDQGRFDLDERGRPKFGPEQVCVGRDLVADAIALVERRCVWARSSKKERERAPRLPLQATPGCEATLEEVGAWIRGEVSDREVLGLARALMALDWATFSAGAAIVPPTPGGVLEPLHLLFRLAHLPFDVPVVGSESKAEVAVSVRLDPEPLRRLAADDLDGALRVAIRRLEASGLRPVFRRAVATPDFARRLAASLAFPISRDDAARAARLVCKPYSVKDVDQQPEVPV
ncbi:MAG: type I-U CRISPR-associated protein Csx17 [Armatimonadota bacterium]|nr:type I-U CRISPR-associated protein Csx17 [Armatimonadota bacterium]